MTGEMINHLWQSTVFAAAVGLLTLAFRRNRAQVRYWLWLGASVKFLIPFSVLIGLGGRLWDLLAAGKIAAETAPAVSQAVVRMTQPFSESLSFAPAAAYGTNWISIAALGVWACGFAGVAVMRVRGWLRVRAALRASVPVDIAIPTTMAVRSTAVLLEPGVVGFLRPVLLLPEGILKNLTRPQLEAVLAHEQCHVRRRDNLTSAIHMIVEAVFWFYPVVWWIGARLMEERERACDEAVLSLGSERQAYAEGILNVCQSYLESPLRCVSGVTGADLKKRIRAIMTGRVAGGLSVARKATLAIAAVAAIAAPIVAGMVGAPWIQAQSSAPVTAALPEFEVATIKPVAPNVMHEMGVHVYPGGRVTIGAFPLKTLIEAAFGLSYWQISGGDEWTGKDEYNVEAKPSPAAASSIKDLRYTLFEIEDEHLREMLQALLIDRFQLRFHRETKTGDVYLLERTDAPFKPQPVESIPPGTDPYSDSHSFGSIGYAGGQWNIYATSMPQLAKFASSMILHVPVLDRTSLSGSFNYRERQPDLDPTYSGDQSASFRGYLKEIGLKLVPGKGPVETFVIDHAEKPSAN